MARHMLKYHVGLPLAVVGVLLLFGVPLATTVRYGMAVGCAAMMLMMLQGGRHEDPTAGDDVQREEEEKTLVNG